MQIFNVKKPVATFALEAHGQQLCEELVRARRRLRWRDYTLSPLGAALKAGVGCKAATQTMTSIVDTVSQVLLTDDKFTAELERWCEERARPVWK